MVELVPLTLDQLDQLASYDMVGASTSIGMPVPPSFLDSQWVWNNLAQLARAEPEHAWWRTQYLAVTNDQGRPRIVGHFRFHYQSNEDYYPSDKTGEVHLGWSIDPLERGRGYAKAGTKALIEMAHDLPEIQTLVALISKENAPSIGVAESVGFTPDGQQPHRFGWIMERYVYPIDR